MRAGTDEQRAGVIENQANADRFAANILPVIHDIERPWREVCDVAFIANDTTSPYLVGPNGYYLRDPQSRKPLIFDLADGKRPPVRKPHQW